MIVSKWLWWAVLLAAPGVASACAPAGWPVDALKALKTSDFDVPDATQRGELALALVDCLASPDPALRDGIAYEGLAHWLRADALTSGLRARLLERLLPMLQSGDADGFAAPFAALALSEVARTDRIAPWLKRAQRARLVGAAADFLSKVRDYRGFIAGEGWRHGVAHGADLALQLALNPKVSKRELDQLLDALFAQVAPVDHAYVFGEPERLARPMLYIAARGLHTSAEWQARLDALLDPAPLDGWQAAFASTTGLARRHDTMAFLLVAQVNAAQSTDAHIQALAPLLLDALGKLP